ncbi:MAG TPA: hypothetical protein VH877_33725 [Polyangia bacterium]|jgi:hypothetical protein|nr:hypothetical protein [Polyangia bacterium]
MHGSSIAMDEQRVIKDTAGQNPVGPTSRFDLVAAIEAGLAGGAVLLLIWMFLVSLPRLGTPWAIMRMVGALVLGRDALSPAGVGEGLFVVLVGVGVHFVLSVVYALPLAALVQRWAWTAAALAGMAWGLLLFLFNFSSLADLFDWFHPVRGWLNLLGHMAYGALAGWSYERFAVPRAHRREILMHPPAPVMP